MKELPNFFGRRYSAVSQNETNSNAAQSMINEHNNSSRRKSLKPTRNLTKGLSIVETFFNDREDGKRTRWPKCAFMLLAGGLLAIATAVLVKVYQPYDLIFKWKLVFEEGGEIFGLWEKPPVDLYIKIYLFNITNTEAFLAGREKMNVEQVGPYVYKELMTHKDVVFNENGTVSTKPSHPLVWQEHLSEGNKEDDVVMMLNIALLSIAQVVAPRSFFARWPINLVIRQTNSQPIVKMTAKEFMFGFETPLTSLGNTLLPGWIYFDKVGLIDRMYDFDTDYETFYTGSQGDPSISGLYDTYLGSKNLKQWNGEHCSNINLASDGTKFKSYIQKNDSVLFFRKSMCRPQNLVRTGDEVQVGDLTGYKYVFEENAFDNGYYEEKNKCFCRKGYCQPRGLIDVTDCYYGFPISLSYPHFMDGDNGLLENITGLVPDPKLHSSFFNIQPNSGLPLDLSVKIQINMHMRDVSGMANVEKFSHTTFPMLWFEITMMDLPQSLKNRFNLYLNILPYIDILGFWGSLTIGILCVAYAITRAISKLPQFMNISDKSNQTTKYAKVNLRSGVGGGGGIYNPCEVKLIEMNEKCINRNDIKIHDYHDLDIMDLKISDDQTYQLEDEPAISDVDDGMETDSSSQKSSIEEYLSDDSSGPSVSSKNITDQTSTMSSGFVSNYPNDSITIKSFQTSDTSSLIDDIGNDYFPPLRIIEDGDITNSNDNLTTITTVASTNQNSA